MPKWYWVKRLIFAFSIAGVVLFVAHLLRGHTAAALWGRHRGSNLHGRRLHQIQTQSCVHAAAFQETVSTQSTTYSGRVARMLNSEGSGQGRMDVPASSLIRMRSVR